MKPTEYSVGHYLLGEVQLHVPTYQRPYSWSEDRWVDLWRDVANQYLRAGSAEVEKHFMGALILEEDDEKTTTAVSAVTVIDGQQRLLTLLILLSAIRDHIAMVDGKVVKPQNDLVLIEPRYGEPVARVFPKIEDAASLSAVLEGKCKDEIPADLFPSAIAEAYRFYRYQLWTGIKTIKKPNVFLPPSPGRAKSAPPIGSYAPWGPRSSGQQSINLPLLHQVITNSLVILELLLGDRDEDAGVIFETMNAKSTPLSQFDLLRNSIFVRLPTKKDEFYTNTWVHAEAGIADVSYRSLRDKPQEQFLYEYLIAYGFSGSLSKDTLHRRWRSAVIEKLGYAVTEESESKFEKQFLEPLARAAFIYPIAVGRKAAIKLQPSGDTFAVGDAQAVRIQELMDMSGGPVVPVVLKALVANQRGKLNEDDLLCVLEDLQSFLVREILCDKSFSPLRATMMNVASRLPSALTLDSVRKALRDADWKTDSEVAKEVVTADSHRWAGRAYFPILRGIERQLSGVSAHSLPYGNGQAHFTIEHIFPQSPNIGKKWVADLSAWGVDPEEMDSRKYSLGNLTAATGFDNKKNGRRPFDDKKALLKATANLKLHDSFKSKSKWTPAHIDARAAFLASVACKRWPRR